jgi:hypothetical protein
MWQSCQSLAARAAAQTHARQAVKTGAATSPATARAERKRMRATDAAVAAENRTRKHRKKVVTRYARLCSTRLHGPATCARRQARAHQLTGITRYTGQTESRTMSHRLQSSLAQQLSAPQDSVADILRARPMGVHTRSKPINNTALGEPARAVAPLRGSTQQLPCLPASAPPTPALRTQPAPVLAFAQARERGS